MSLASTILGLSPYGWWRCGDTSGGTLTDSSGNARNGTIHAGTIGYSQPSLTSDGELSLQLSSTSSWLTLLSGSAGNPGIADAAFTLGYIYRPTTIANTFMAGGGGGSPIGWELVQTGTHVNLTAGANGITLIGSCTNAAAGITANGNPIILWVTYDGAGNWAIYVNNNATPIITATGQSITPGSSNLLQVGSASNGSAGCPGYYQDIQVYNSVLSTANMAAVYNAAQLQNFVTIAATVTVTNNTTNIGLAWTGTITGGFGPYTYDLYRGETSQLATTGMAHLVTAGSATTYTDSAVPDKNIQYYRLVITDSLMNTGTANLVPGQLRPALCICAIGDSRTLGANGGGTDPVTDLATVLTDLLTPIVVTTSNQGVNGSKTGDWLSGSGNLNTALTAFNTAGAALPTGGKLYVQIALGVNDADGATPVTVATYLANLANIIAAIKAANIPKFAGVVLQSAFYAPPYASSGNYTELTNNFVLQYNAALQSLTDNKTVFLGDTLSYDYFALNYGVLTDGLHPNAAGYVSLATLWGQRYTALYGGAGAAVAAGTTYPASNPLRTIASGTAYVTTPWTIPAVGSPGSTGAVQTGNTSVQVNTAQLHAADELLNLVDRMILDGRASLY